VCDGNIWVADAAAVISSGRPVAVTCSHQPELRFRCGEEAKRAK